ncbi:regulating synaptic membrane exocytosis protein 4-like [Glandiceps talaboti]
MTGEIKLVLRKDTRHEGDTNLHVQIVQARKITYKFKVTDHLPDLYVKAYMIVGHKRISKKKTRICRHDLEPTFNETFQYNANVKGLALQIMLWADGGRFGRNTLIGEALIWLDTINFNQGAVDGWYKLFLSPLSPLRGSVRTP